MSFALFAVESFAAALLCGAVFFLVNVIDSDMAGTFGCVVIAFCFTLFVCLGQWVYPITEITPLYVSIPVMACVDIGLSVLAYKLRRIK